MVLSADLSFKARGAVVCRSMEETLAYLEEFDPKDIYIPVSYTHLAEFVADPVVLSRSQHLHLLPSRLLIQIRKYRIRRKGMENVGNIGFFAVRKKRSVDRSCLLYTSRCV